MIVTAAVYRQEKPEIIRPVRHFVGADGNRYMEHESIFTHLGDVTGTHDECWTQAKAMTKFPVLEFPRGMYKFKEE